MEPALTHAQRVLRLYRHALQAADSWSSSRKDYRRTALEIRARFDRHKQLANAREAARLLAAGEVCGGVRAVGV